MASKTKAKTKKKGCPEGHKQVRVKPPKDGRSLPPSARFKCVPIKPPKDSKPGKGALIDDNKPDLPDPKKPSRK